MSLIISRKFFFILYVIVVIALCFSRGLEMSKLYKNYVVYEVFAIGEEHINVLQEMECSSDSLIFPFGVTRIENAVHIVVAPHKIPDFKLIMSRHDLKYRENISNLQQHLDAIDIQLAQDERSKRSLFNDLFNAVFNKGPYNWRSYKSLERTYVWMNNLVKKFPNVVDLLEIGSSYEGRELYVVKISHKDNREKPGIFLEAGIHGREWIAPAAATYIINALLRGDDIDMLNLAQNYDWYIMPHANPDGYAYSQTSDRLWRKTRTRYGINFGADPNRNWGYYWKEIGACSAPHSSNFAGPKPFSEKATLALSNFIQSLKGKIKLYVSFHSFAQALVYPYGYTRELPDNVEDLKLVAKKTIEALEQPYGTKYSTGALYHTLYPAAGVSIDWVYGAEDVKMAFTFELRPRAQGQPIKVGMQLPTDQIIPTANETLVSLVAMIAETEKLGYFNMNN